MLQKKNGFKGADARRFAKLISYALMDSNLFSLEKYHINIVHSGFELLQSEASAIRIQKFVRSCYRNAKLNKTLIQLHHLCTLPYIRPADLEIVKSTLSSDSTLKMVRNRRKDYSTLTQSALIGCNIAVLSLLNPTFRELIEVDSKGRCSIHYLSYSPNMKVAMCLAGILNAVTAFLPVAIDCSESLLRTAFSVDSAGCINYCSKVVKVGWLLKQPSLGYSRWHRRWLVLCEDSISYYSTADTATSKARRTLMLSSCVVKRVVGHKLDHCFEIISEDVSHRRPFLGSKQPRRLLFKASSEDELQSWLKYLCGLTGSIVPIGVTNAPSTRYVNFELRERWVSAVDKDMDTALHIMVRHNKGRNIEAVKQIAWLVDNGCAVNAQNAHGHTALHLAVEGGANRDMIRCLLSKGADVSKIEDNEGRTVLDLSAAQLKSEESEHAGEIVTDGRSKQLLHELLLRHLEEVKLYEQYYFFAEFRLSLRLFTGYTYLSLYLGKMSFSLDNDPRAVVPSPSITISVYSGRNELIEEVQEVWNPAMARPNMIYWGWSWHMNTPLENLPPPCENGNGCYIVFESRDKRRMEAEVGLEKGGEATPSALLCRVKLPLDLAAINSGPKTLRAENFSQHLAPSLSVPPDQQTQASTSPQKRTLLDKLLPFNFSNNSRKADLASTSSDSNLIFPHALSSCESTDEGAHLSIDIILSHGTSGC